MFDKEPKPSETTAKPTAESNDNEGPGETQQQLADRQGAGQAVADVYNAADTTKVLQSRRVEQAEGVVSHWYARVDSGVTELDLERPSFWAHHAALMRPGDEVDAKCVDGTYLAKMVVRAVGPQDVVMHIWAFIELDPIDPDAFAVPSGYSIGWAGDLDKWRVLRGTDIVRAGFEQRSIAQKWLGNHVASLAR